MPPVNAHTLPTRGNAELTPCQDAALDRLSREGNVFLTGAAGTGKSFLLSRYLAGKSSDDFPIVASTGAAAVLVGGRTFHSFFGLGIFEGGVEAAIARALRSSKLVYRLRRACCVIIDEVSMLSGTTLAAAERVSRLARNSSEPWGGLRIIAVGDFAQLPPVTPGSQQKDWAFLHPAWHESVFEPALLSTVMRTKDAAFLDILNLIRTGTVNDDVTAFLEAHTSDEDDDDATHLYAHRLKADAYNTLRLEAIPRRERSFKTRYEGDERSIEAAKRSMPIPDVLTLKEDALVMMRKNDISPDMLYVNGSLGHIVEIEEETLHIALLSGETIEVAPQQFTTLNGDGKPVAAAWNFPVTLAWATTIHKAQGASLDRMVVDLAALWEPGQAYVALSRVRSAAGLMIRQWHPSCIRAEPLVTELYDRLADAAKSYVPRPLFTPEERATVRESEGDDAPRTRSTKAQRSKTVLRLLRSETPLVDIATACNITVDRVLLTIEELLAEETTVSLRYLVEDLPELPRVRVAFAECGTGKLRPAYDALGGDVPYSTVRLVRCVLRTEGEA